MSSFEEIMLPHLPTAYSLARWLLRNNHEAEDSVQEAYLRAFKVFGRFRGGDGRSWLLTIVRNECYDRLRRMRRAVVVEPFDEELHADSLAGGLTPDPPPAGADPETLRAALDALPEAMREVVVLHDLEGLTYREISAVADIPIGTVMSRLSRSRARLQQEVLARTDRIKA
jgi:RNA polymerase sigma-70 factor (ECF subfamily)